MRKNQQLVIVLPESSEELPIRIVRGSRSMELRLRLCPPDGEERHINETCPERKYVFIWRQNDYLKAAVDEIQWIEAAGSYSRIHLTGGRPRNFFQPRIGQAQAARKRLHPDPSFPHRKPQACGDTGREQSEDRQ